MRKITKFRKFVLAAGVAAVLSGVALGATATPAGATIPDGYKCDGTMACVAGWATCTVTCFTSCKCTNS